MRVLRIDPDGTLTTHDRGFNDIKADLKGAMIEGKYLDDCMLFFDEDGRMKRLPFNPVASIAAQIDLVGVVYAVNPDDTQHVDDAAVHRITTIRFNLAQIGVLS